MPGPTKYSSALTTRSPPRPADHHLRVERDQRRRRVRRTHRHAAVRVEDRVLAVDRRRRVRVADVAAGAVARPAAAVIPAARVLRHVAAERPLVADLRRGHQLRRLHQQPELLPHHRMLARPRSASSCAPISRPPLTSLIPRSSVDLAQVDHHLRSASTRSFSQSNVSSPPASTQRIGPVPVQQRQRIVDRSPAGTARTPASRRESLP